MFDKLNLWWGKVSGIVKVLSGVIAVASAITGVVSWNNSLVIKKYNERVNEQVSADANKTVAKKVDSLVVRFDSFIKTQHEYNTNTSAKLDQIVTSQLALKKYMVEKASTKEDVDQIWQIFDDIKKNSYPLIPQEIVLKSTSSVLE